ncbi:glycosyltransferase family 2 protein [Mongoliibacter ruber]|uniref:GT2 family glycosyltransferase n=1 Tax=Mongoliibacter ruber TaxID=1750599 RepID=A0A2T0WNY0_9BACT|nr:glycosyltransferase [Mongoliibacter ruber]PRY88399.1 GT2 family glycosyltransferase [Mongoliibacter ruber]
MNENSCISIVVLTYNSEKFVEETLDSIYDQSYPNIELIVADDCSSDRSVELVQKWIGGKKERFVNFRLIASPKNTGTSANCNRGLHVAAGEWVKFIAGDDVLHTDFFTRMSPLLRNEKVNVIAGEVHTFENDISEAQFNWPDFDFPTDLSVQRRRQLVKGLLLAPSVVIRKSKISELKGFDEKFKLLEDDPMWFKLTLDHNLFYFAQDSIVYYRQHSESVNSIAAREIYYRKPIFLNDLINFGYGIRVPALAKEGLWAHVIFLYLGLLCENLIYKNGSKLDNILNRILKKFVLLFHRIYVNLPY